MEINGMKKFLPIAFILFYILLNHAVKLLPQQVKDDKVTYSVISKEILGETCLPFGLGYYNEGECSHTIKWVISSSDGFVFTYYRGTAISNCEGLWPCSSYDDYLGGGLEFAIQSKITGESIFIDASQRIFTDTRPRNMDVVFRKIASASSPFLVVGYDTAMGKSTTVEIYLKDNLKLKPLILDKDEYLWKFGKTEDGRIRYAYWDTIPVSEDWVRITAEPDIIDDIILKHFRDQKVN
jgi:hypothetical protein